MAMVGIENRRRVVLMLASLLAAANVTACRNGHASSDEAELEARATRPRYVETRELVTHLAEELLRVHEVTGVSLALVDGDELVWATGFGHANAELELPAGPRTIYNMGSITKPVTVAAILQAVERGELRLEQPLAELLPELELADDAAQRITLEQLITHQSGLPSDWFIHELSESPPPPWPAIVEEVRGLALAVPPGELTMYSNLGMTLAGAALERASGRRYEDAVTELLLRPAGMRTAYFPGGPEPEPVLMPIADGKRGLEAVEHAASYRENELRLDPRFRMHPAGGLRASVLDLAAFASLMLSKSGGASRRFRKDGRELLGADAIAAMLTPHNEQLEFDLDHRFGYGWFLDHDELDWVGRVAWHGGRTYYHHSLLIILPDHGLAVAVASNSMSAAGVVEALAVETLLGALQEKHGLEPPPPAPAVEHHEAPPEVIEAFEREHAGDYATSTGLSTIGVIDVDGKAEVWSRSANGRARLTLEDPDGGTVESMPGARVRFVEAAGEHLMCIERGGVRRATGVRLGPPPPIPPAWAARTGPWTVLERPGEVSIIANPHLRISGGRLQFEYTGLLEHPPLPLVMVLEPIDDRRARIAGRGRGGGTIVEIRGEGDDERLWWLGREFRRDL